MSASFYYSTIFINQDECVCEAWLRTQKHCRNGVGTGENALFINSIETINFYFHILRCNKCLNSLIEYTFLKILLMLHVQVCTENKINFCCIFTLSLGNFWTGCEFKTKKKLFIYFCVRVQNNYHTVFNQFLNGTKHFPNEFRWTKNDKTEGNPAFSLCDTIILQYIISWS